MRSSAQNRQKRGHQELQASSSNWQHMLARPEAVTVTGFLSFTIAHTYTHLGQRCHQQCPTPQQQCQGWSQPPAHNNGCMGLQTQRHTCEKQRDSCKCMLTSTHTHISCGLLPCATLTRVLCSKYKRARHSMQVQVSKSNTHTCWSKSRAPSDTGDPSGESSNCTSASRPRW